MSLRRQQDPAPGSELVITLVDLAIVHRVRGSCAEAQRLETEAEKLVVDEGVGGSRLASYLNNRAFSLNNRWADPRAAEAFYRLALTIKEREPEGDPASLARAHHNLAVALELEGKYPEAAEHLEGALEMRRSIHGDSSMEVARTLNALVALLQHTDDLERAARYARESLGIRRKEPSRSEPDVAKAENSLAVILRLQGHLEVAEELLRQAAAGLRERYGEGTSVSLPYG